jgi:hypothetical protein
MFASASKVNNCGRGQDPASTAPIDEIAVIGSAKRQGIRKTAMMPRKIRFICSVGYFKSIYWQELDAARAKMDGPDGRRFVGPKQKLFQATLDFFLFWPPEDISRKSSDGFLAPGLADRLCVSSAT